MLEHQKWQTVGSNSIIFLKGNPVVNENFELCTGQYLSDPEDNFWTSGLYPLIDTVIIQLKNASDKWVVW